MTTIALCTSCRRAKKEKVGKDQETAQLREKWHKEQRDTKWRKRCENVCQVTSAVIELSATHLFAKLQGVIKIGSMCH